MINRSIKATIALLAIMLAVGRYHVTVSVMSMTGGLETLTRCLELNVVVSDILGTGKLPPHKDGVLVTRGEWHVEP